MSKLKIIVSDKPIGANGYYRSEANMVVFEKSKLTSPLVVHESVHVALHRLQLNHQTVNDTIEEVFAKMVTDTFFEIMAELQERGFRI